ncbi:endolytic transglycosylase MltG [Sphingorhabdus arenilitoris]|uniref:Endolytic murein transglycosylase n=1 Tax=Sphingorhabdus arenilitoris TaxID=1490041 RepID=A0ABV8RHL0_9SPHN
MRAVKILSVIGLLLFLIVGGNFVYGWTAAGPSTRDVTIIIKPGSSIALAAQQLEKGGIIKSADAFVTRAKILGRGKTIKAGEFEIPARASNSDILTILSGGKTVQRMVTIPEGMPSIMVYERLMANEQLKGEIAVPAEGSVLPDSYAFEKGESRAAVLKRMQDAMSKALNEAWENRSSTAAVKTPQEAVNLAAIVEKETAKKSELRKVAGVYSNRLFKGMLLQADPTIIYPVTKGKPLGRRIRRSEIEAVNGYNTYTKTGLPDGPIANPSKAAIEAVLNPEKTSALYFVADGKGGHIFADTLEEHNANVEKWFAIRRQRGEM